MYDENLLRYKFADVPEMIPQGLQKKANTQNEHNELRLVSKLLDFFKG